MSGAVHIGCSGWNYRSWRGRLYAPGTPAGRWLEVYAEGFETVEVNATFYRLISRETASRWVEQTPSRFTFAVKASRYLTHIKRLADDGASGEIFRDRIEPLAQAGRLGPVLWQLPETFHADTERLRGALGRLWPGRHAFEFRHPSWFNADVYELLAAHDVALVIGDDPSRPFQTTELTAGWRYIRFHRGRRGRRGNYSERELEEWAGRIDEWRGDGEIYAYFNNDWEGFAPRNAVSLRAKLDALARP